MKHDLKFALVLILSFSVLLLSLSGCGKEASDDSLNSDNSSQSSDDSESQSSDDSESQSSGSEGGGRFGNIFDDVSEYEYSFGKNPEYYEGALTIAFEGGGDLQSIIRDALANGEQINVVEYPMGIHADALNLKLMAGDSDIDIFFTFYLDTYTYITSGYYEDLSQYDVLREKFESNEFVNHVASYNGTYVGLPIECYYYDTATNEQNDSFTKYLVKNVSALNGEFRDENGDELFELLRYLYDNPDDPRSDPFYEDTEVRMIGGDFLMINPYSERKEEAAEFLAYCFDLLTGEKTMSTRTIAIPYPTGIDDFEGVALYWDFQPWTIIEPLREAYNTLRQTDGTDAELRKLATDAASGTSMRLYE